VHVEPPRFRLPVFCLLDDVGDLEGRRARCKGVEVKRAWQVATTAIYSGSRPERSPRYKAFIRAQASVVSGLGGCDPCHTGPHAGGQKSSDKDCIPLTRREHTQFDVDPRGYAELHGLDILALIRRFNAEYDFKFGGTKA